MVARMPDRRFVSAAVTSCAVHLVGEHGEIWGESWSDGRIEVNVGGRTCVCTATSQHELRAGLNAGGIELSECELGRLWDQHLPATATVAERVR